MAGGTSRFLISLSIPFFSFIIWFLKRKVRNNAANRSVQVEDPVTSEFDLKFVELNQMKLKNREENRDDPSDSSSMQLKENQASPTSDVPQQNYASASGKKSGKSKIREKVHTCAADYIVNGNDNLQDNGTELAVAFESIDLNGPSQDELLNAINKSTSEMDMHDTNCVSQSDAPQHIVNGDAERVTEKITPEQQDSGCEQPMQCADTDSPSGDKGDQYNDRTGSQESLLPADCSDAQGDQSSTGATYCDSVDKEDVREVTSISEPISHFSYNTPEYPLSFSIPILTGYSAPFPISNDSGRGGSEIHFEASSLQLESNVLNYEFEISQEYVGRLIGKNGSTVKSIKSHTNANIYVKQHPSCSQSKICLLTGTEDEINSALRLIRKKFPIEKFPSVTLSQVCFLPFMPCPENLVLRLPEGTSVDVVVSNVVSAGHFFVQQPTHPTYFSLVGLSLSMMNVYSNDANAPALPHMERGYICAVYTLSGWYRAEICEVFPERDECQIKFLDFGGYADVPRSDLRQINYQFMNVPFQAIECYLAYISPFEGETEFSLEATAYLEQLRTEVVQVFIVAYAEDGIPLVQMYKISGATMVDINRELINSGLVRSIEPQPELVS